MISRRKKKKKEKEKTKFEWLRHFLSARVMSILTRNRSTLETSDFLQQRQSVMPTKYSHQTHKLPTARILFCSNENTKKKKKKQKNRKTTKKIQKKKKSKLTKQPKKKIIK